MQAITQSIPVMKNDSVFGVPVEFMDSMHYASYIQQAIFGQSLDFIRKMEFESFLLHKPKEVISGDFYWSYRIMSKRIIVVGDCTGHGVPGAMLTIFAQSALSRVVAEGRVTDPAEILKRTHQLFRETFTPGNHVGGVGMDVAVCSIDLDTKTLEYAGAFNPLWIVRQGELTELKPSRNSIGNHENDGIHFETQAYRLNKNDNVYLFTDGFEDQFGGDTKMFGKKFLKKRLRSLLMSVSNLPSRLQEQKLLFHLYEWKKGWEQIDDICLCGIKIG